MSTRIVRVCLALGFLLAATGATAAMKPMALMVSQELNATEIDRLLRQHRRAFASCHEKRAAAGVSLAGTVTLEWTLGANGAVIKAAVVADKSSVADDEFAACLVSRMLRLRFSEGSRPGTVTLVLNLTVTDPERGSGKVGDKELRIGGLFRSGSGGALLSGGIGKSSGRAGIGAVGVSPRGVASRGVALGSGSGKVRGSAVMMTRNPGAPGREARTAVGSSAITVRAAPSLKAGRHDDNKQFNRFVQFLAEHRADVPYPLDVSERIVLRTLDQEGRSLANCEVTVASPDGGRLARSVTFADGATQFFPNDAGRDAERFVVDATCGAVRKQVQFDRHGPRSIELGFDISRRVPAQVPLDVAVVIDTTGSMGGQIARLKQTLRAIHLQLTELSTKPDIRFGLVAYRDRGDEYVTRVTPFTRNVEAFQRTVRALVADGGGDTPEELQPALHEALEKLDWRVGAVRLGFVIADAMPHTDYPNQRFTYRDAMRDSLARGIKWSMVGAGGLSLGGELVFRQIAQHTMGEYVFVTPHEVQRDTGGDDTEASHHVGTNYQVENLDQAIVRIVRRELSYLTDQPRELDDTIIARASAPLSRDKVLAPAAQEVLRQLADYSAIRIAVRTPVAIVPLEAPDAPGAGPLVEYLFEQLTLAASRRGDLRVVERDLAALAQEQRLQFSELVDPARSVQFGRLVGAELLIVTRLALGDAAGELYAKLVRVETGEILSAAKVQFEGEALRIATDGPTTALLAPAVD